MNINRLHIAIVFSFCLLLACINITSASVLEVSEDLTIVGNGTIDRDFGAESAPDFTGQKLTETIVPVYFGRVNATSYYRSNFEFVLSNNSTIYYESVSELASSKHYLSNQNFDLGVYTGFDFIGDQNKSFFFASAPSLSEALVESEVEGRSVVRARVVNKTHAHYPQTDSLTWLQGNYSLGWAFLVRDVEFPEAGEDDWLGCP